MSPYARGADDYCLYYVHLPKPITRKEARSIFPSTAPTYRKALSCSAMTSSGNPVTLRLMTEHDLPMLHDWLNRPHIVEWWGGDEARPTLREVTERYLPRVLVKVGVTPYIAMLNQEPIGYAQSYVALGAGDGCRRKRQTREFVEWINPWQTRLNLAKVLEPSWLPLWSIYSSQTPR